ncbi:rhodanese-like domain-containing protein [Daejeonella oryzae]|uniref:rhodanese-like domain-containing protein n=1 Tax=Daejeonella oryzae TaxID=1122943 RepID=UPI00040AC80B|nr:rhodanese-like domain-containing protein [Daejeonella oryzae]
MAHSIEFEKLVDEVKKNIAEISVSETLEKLKEGTNLIDVREDNEWDKGHIKGAVHLGRGIIERDIIDQFPDKNAELILYCGGGFRSALSAENLQKMGYQNVFSMAGGWRAWQDANGPVELK